MSSIKAERCGGTTIISTSLVILLCFHPGADHLSTVSVYTGSTEISVKLWLSFVKGAAGCALQIEGYLIKMSETRSSASSSSSGGALFAPVQHPVLRSVDPKRVSEFLRERERYVDEVEEKRKQVPTMSVASYKVSVDRSLLKTMKVVCHLSHQVYLLQH